MSTPWYALHVASNCERQVTDRLADAGIESFYPYCVARSRDNRRDLQRKLMPGYVFARFNLADRTPVVTIPQVIRILGWAHHAVALPDSEIAAVRLMTLSATASLTACPYVAAGEAVVIQRGSLAGLEGFVLFAKPGKAHVVVSVTLLQRSVRATVDVADLFGRAAPQSPQELEVQPCQMIPPSMIGPTATPSSVGA